MKSTSESEEAKEGHFIDLLFGVMNLLEETEMGITLDGVIAVGNHAGEGIGDIATLDNSRCLLHVPCQQNE
jgi:hypothetical protein